ncbi:MAG: transglutaminase [Planctomycetaceae bacterium]|nr:transglutaminase [Planctomycetaceae bacterium]
MKFAATTSFVVSLGFCLALGSTIFAGQRQGRSTGAPKSRTFRLDYGASLSELPPNARVRVWLPVPQSNDHQKITVVKTQLPTAGQTAIEPTYGNKILYFETADPPSGRLAFKVSYLVHRHEIRALKGETGQTKLTDEQRNLFLAAQKRVPLTGKPFDLLNGVTFSSDPLTLARTLYDRVDDHVRYDKSRPGYGHGDVLWVCDSRFGNCTDFHSLFISWARAKGLPTRFEIGFPLPPQRGAGNIGGYHCWALFYSAEKGWVPVDISEADKHPQLKDYFFGNLTEDRVGFTTGRDIDLIPRQDGDPLNYFVHPYVEVNGRAWSREKLELDLAYTDIKTPLP